MKKVLYTITILTITIGIIGFCINLIFPNSITYMSYIQINGIRMIKYDFLSYAKNIENTFKNVAELELILQTREWQEIQGDIIQQQFWDALVNNMAFSLNVIITGLNILLYPLRIGFYAIQSLLAIVGVPTMQAEGTGLEWLVTVCKTITQLQIPYV